MRYTLIVILAMLSSARLALAADDYRFDEKELEKEVSNKPYYIGGYAELTSSLFILDRDAALYRLKYYKQNKLTTTGEHNGGLQLDGSLEWGIARATARVYSYADYSSDGWEYKPALYEGYVSLKPSSMITFDVGKKNLKWGKGYAWNPVGFVDRLKNPEDPERPIEGYSIASMDMIISINSPLKTLSFTPVLFPVYSHINHDFGTVNRLNYAGRLYALLFDTDIDFLFLSGGSRTQRFGADFSRNITASMEVHGEFAYIPHFEKKYIDERGTVAARNYPARNYLGGIRYLTEWEMTVIVEYYRNESGYTGSEMRDYYAFVNYGYDTYVLTGNDLPLQKAAQLQKGGYGKINPMTNYLYARISQKEPFDILYFTPAITWIFNSNDRSYTLMPEVLYAPITNLELRLRTGFIVGRHETEFGEKPNDYKVDFRVRYYF